MASLTNFSAVCLSVLLAYIVVTDANNLDEALEDTLQFVTVIFRHGDRTPINPYPNDPHKDPSNWPVGFGQLTPRGKRMQYGLGQYLRGRYGTLVGQDYSEDTIFVRSTDVDRTLMSAESNLAGFFPPSGKQVWNQQIAWQPVPVHTVPLIEDNLLAAHSLCPRMAEAISEVLDSKEVVAINKKNQKVYDYISKHSGTNVTNMIDVDYIFDTLYIEQLYNMSLPEWTRAVFPEKLRLLRDLSFTITTWTHELKRLRSGPLISDVLESMYKSIKREDTFSARKMNMYSAHDTTISSFLNGLSMFEPPVAPPYIATVMVELHKSTREGEDNYFVRFLYRNDTGREPYRLTLPGCTFDCPLGQFDALTKDLRPVDWAAECKASHSDVDLAVRYVTYSSVIICILLAVILVAAVAATFLRKRDGTEEHHQYLSVQQDLA